MNFFSKFAAEMAFLAFFDILCCDLLCCMEESGRGDREAECSQMFNLPQRAPSVSGNGNVVLKRITNLR